VASRIALQELEKPDRWSENSIAKALVHAQLFHGKLLVVPRTSWTGHECDLLAIDQPSLRLIDLEIKISRSDLLADPKKDKWWSRGGWLYRENRWAQETQREWPPKVWKHYYVMPREIWRKDTATLEARLPKNSGVLLIWRDFGKVQVSVARRSKPNKDAKPIDHVDVLDIARLAGYRMWDALVRMEA
jgi:hypothetical protein